MDAATSTHLPSLISRIDGKRVSMTVSLKRLVISDYIVTNLLNDLRTRGK